MTKDHEQIVSERIISDASIVTGFLVRFRGYMVTEVDRSLNGVGWKPFLLKRMDIKNHS